MIICGTQVGKKNWKLPNTKFLPIFKGRSNNKIWKL